MGEVSPGALEIMHRRDACATWLFSFWFFISRGGSHVWLLRSLKMKKYGCQSNPHDRKSITKGEVSWSLLMELGSTSFTLGVTPMPWASLWESL